MYIRANSGFGVSGWNSNLGNTVTTTSSYGIRFGSKSSSLTYSSDSHKTVITQIAAAFGQAEGLLSQKRFAESHAALDRAQSLYAGLTRDSTYRTCCVSVSDSRFYDVFNTAIAAIEQAKTKQEAEAKAAEAKAEAARQREAQTAANQASATAFTDSLKSLIATRPVFTPPGQVEKSSMATPLIILGVMGGVGLIALIAVLSIARG